MKRILSHKIEAWPIRGSFKISRGFKTEAAVILCSISQDGITGRGECVPYARYGETLESVSSQIEAVREQIETGVVHEEVVGVMPPGAARNAIDCAFWDLNAKRSGIPAYKLVCGHPPRPVTTATTISLGTASKMADAAKAVADYPSLKVKLGGEGDIERIHAVTDAAPESRI
ncbi:MAG: dipeptide epimerase, partial [Rhizobiaceae bacterium]